MESAPHLPSNDLLERMRTLSERITSLLAAASPIDPSLQGPGPEFLGRTLEAATSQAIDPAKIFADQVEVWKAFVDQMADAEAAPQDRRFTHPDWRENPTLKLIRAQYDGWAKSMQGLVNNLPGLGDRERRRLRYFTNQALDALAPSNFLALNPEALQRAIETEGQSLINGMENLARDLEIHRGRFQVSLADSAAFVLGKDLAATPGEVIFRNEILELIEYHPKSEKCYQLPLVIFPPWINKFYILDLRPGNSLVEWLVQQGFRTCVVSWKNPGPDLAEIGMDDYVAKGYLTVIEFLKRRFDVERVNAVGYCIAGTTLAMTVSRLQQLAPDSLASGSFLTTLTDFSDQGEFSVFLEEDFVAGIERVAREKGVLEAYYMTRTFSFLRSNDLIWGPAVRAYLLGDKPKPFDLLSWNSDATNLPARMTVEYLRGLCQADLFARDGFPLLGGTAQIRDVNIPVFSVACETDHIAAWRASFNGWLAMGSADKTFVLAESGHIAGIVNAPARGKYGYFTNPEHDTDPDDWKQKAAYSKGSWWPLWAEWLARRSGPLVKAQKVTGSLGAAPGTYVLEPAPKV